MTPNRSDRAALDAAAQRLHDFADSWNPGDQIDEDSKLTVDDLRLILARLTATENVVMIQKLDFNNLPPELRGEGRPE